MSRTALGCMLLLAAFSGTVQAQDGRPVVVTSHEAGADEFSEELLGGRQRPKWQRPDLVMRLLSNIRAETVGEIGAGMGFFTHRLSNLVGSDGKVYAVEFDPGLLEGLEVFVARLPKANCVVVRGTTKDPGLPSGELDMVLSVNTWHHVGDRAAMREAVQRALKPGGRFVVIDWRQGEIPLAPPEEHRLPRTELIDEMKADGWTMTTDSRALEYQYFMIFVPPAG